MLTKITTTMQRARAISRLGFYRSDRLYLFLWLFILPVYTRFGLSSWLRPPLVFNVCIAARRTRISLSDPLELVQLQMIFGAAEYKSTVDSAQYIIDLGGNIGLAALYFYDRFPSCQIHVYEPDPRTFAYLKRNTATCTDRITLHQCAVADVSGECTFYSHQRSESSSLHDRNGAVGVEVPVTTFDAIIESLGVPRIDIVKFDIEGAEGKVFGSATTMSRVKEFVGEFHHDLSPVSISDFAANFSEFAVSYNADAHRRTFFRAKKETPHDISG